MPRTLWTFLVIVPMALLTACSGSSRPEGTHGLRPVTQASAERKAATLDRIKSLAGTWESADEKGGMHVSSVFTVSSNGSAVREVMLPGTPHEMTNMYTMDGPDLVVTHYCAMGNQPHMRSAAAGGGSGPNTIVLKFDGVSNLASQDQLYMGEMTITFKDADHISVQWQSFKNEKPAGHDPAFELTRRK